MSQAAVNTSSLPLEIRAKLAELELELSEGDITQKGFEKKRARLLAPYAQQQQQQQQRQEQLRQELQRQQHQNQQRQQQQRHGQSGQQGRHSGSGGSGGGHGNERQSQAQRRRDRRRGRHDHRDERYRSDIHAEAVQQALAQHSKRNRVPVMPMPSKRQSLVLNNPVMDTPTELARLRHFHSQKAMRCVAQNRLSLQTPVQSGDSPVPSGDSDTSSDDESIHSGRLSTSSPEHPSRQPSGLTKNSAGGSRSSVSSQSTTASGAQGAPGGIYSIADVLQDSSGIFSIADVLQGYQEVPSSSQKTTQQLPPDVTSPSVASQTFRMDRTIDRRHRPQPKPQQPEDENDSDLELLFPVHGKVSAKIQQLLNTLKRPKRKPLREFFVDEEEELEAIAKEVDPNAPKAEGPVISPAVGESLAIPSGLPRNLEAAVQRYGSASYKATVITALDATGKHSITLTYGKLLSRMQKIAFSLLNKVGQKEPAIRPGDRVALVYPNSDPISFMCAFYGCLYAGVVPVPIEVPLTRKDAGSQQIGFLLGSCGVSVALTSEACLKGLPKGPSGEVAQFKGWPRLTWFVTEHLSKPAKDWMPPPRLSDEQTAYIEYTTAKDGSVMGVTVNRGAMLCHCRTLTAACNYTEGEIIVNVLDFKRDVGLWHSILTSVFNGMHVVFVPYSLMKVNPTSWLHMVTRFKATCATVKSRDMHWALVAQKDQKDINLSSLRMLLVADGANPWSLSSCDAFLNVFQNKGLKPEAICPTASSAEALTVAVRRPGRTGGQGTGRGVLSMSGLSYGVVRVDTEDKLTSLILQDVGTVMPGAVAVIVKVDNAPGLCKTDEVGEICVASGAIGAGYFGLQGLSNNTFKIQPLASDGKPMAEQTFVRTGLLGFLGPGGMIFVVGKVDGLMNISGRRHNTDDIIATVLAVEPMKFIYRGRIAVFSIKVLRDERIVIIAEQRPDSSEEDSFQWMSRVLQAIDSIHQVGVYCLLLVPANSLPKTPLGGIHLWETKQRFMEGSLHPCNVLMCPHTCVTNLPKPRQKHPEVGPSSVMVGNLVQGRRIAGAQGRDIGTLDGDDEQYRKGFSSLRLSGKQHIPSDPIESTGKTHQFLSEILQWRAATTPEEVLFSQLNAKGGGAGAVSCMQLHKRAERIGCLLLEKGKINTGDHVALIFTPGIDLIAAVYGCFYVGAVPVPVRPPHHQNIATTLPTVKMIVDVSKSVAVLTMGTMLKLLKSKEAASAIDVKTWPVLLDCDDTPRKKLSSIYRAPTPEMLAYLDFSVSTTGMLAGIKMSHSAASNLSRSLKLQAELYPSRTIALCLDPFCGLGFVLWCLVGVYAGHHTILIPPADVEANPSLWLMAVSQNKVRDVFCSYGVIEISTKGLGGSTGTLRAKGVNLSGVRTCVVVAEERPRINLCNSFSKLFKDVGLSPRAVSTTFGCRVNVAVCCQGTSGPDPTSVFVDMRALRNDRVTLVEKGSPHSLCLMESGKILPGVKVVIANPETKGQCGDSHLGEIWVSSPHSASGYFTIYGDESLQNDHFSASLTTGDTTQVYSRTGYLGFLRQTDLTNHAGEYHDALYIVGSLDETLMLRGMRYHPIDIENSVLRCHKNICECAVFTWTNLLVVVVELEGPENEALDLIPLVTNVVLEEHYLIVGVVVVVDPGVIPINSRGEKQRMHLRDGFLADQLDPIYVAYNM
ncbi:disco-interacting protein 2 homolog C-like isoform X6 [Branchiostoma floridae]|uniref:Disco-interacting protein 2 homolog C-like isoform X6 n=1 Tax=Branchiostoma floridae TaxID=7739 RepID=A0A9J7HLU2_BRAFL|nr:disco-interacting protein 2 homolog C-like isoform X6 [Branchiostoma floridae]